MKVSYQWLQEFVKFKDSAEALADRLSLAGLEVAAVEDAIPPLDDIVVGEVLAVEKHPGADKLNVCQVTTDGKDRHQIVCGAPNVRAGMKAPVILPGAKLPDGTKIKKARLRGVESHGMLCSARELGLSEDHAGLMDLPSDAPVGKELAEFLGKGDKVIEIEITPNRGDCLGMLGMARDVAALVNAKVVVPEHAPVKADIKDTIEVEVKDATACPTFLGRVIKGIDPHAETPLWMQERLRRAGIRPISPVVDVTQYVMIELGQPMHGYDLREVQGGIVVRFAKQGEKFILLDGEEKSLESDMLMIADKKRLLGLAGIMGGKDSGVQDDTTDIYLECAYFDNSTITGRPRRLGLHTDAGYRFERGVDPSGQRRAIERATRLLLDITGGKPGPVAGFEPKKRPARNNIMLRKARLASLLGMDIPDADVERILSALEMPPKAVKQGWEVQAPSHRFDIEIEEDLIEEVGRIHGYDHIEPVQYPSTQPMKPAPETRVSLMRLKDVLVQRGYQEVITYSFVSAELQEMLAGEKGIPLANPITADMTHMRCNLWSGLVKALEYNLNRQQARVRIFECGMRFIQQVIESEDKTIQEDVISGLVSGNQWPLQWGMPERPVEFADVMSDIQALAALSGMELHASAAGHPGLHPGQTARLLNGDKEIGWVGALHPGLQESLGLSQGAIVFELELAALQEAAVPKMKEISRYPAISRDLALLVDENLPASRLIETARSAEPALLQEVRLFDIYQGKGVDSGLKSIALSLILQDSSRTLNDDDIDRVMARIAGKLRDELGARVRD